MHITLTVICSIKSDVYHIFLLSGAQSASKADNNSIHRHYIHSAKGELSFTGNDKNILKIL